jgi:hypothetical protein
MEIIAVALLLGLTVVVGFAWILSKLDFLPSWLCHVVLVISTGLIGNAFYAFFRRHKDA